jgi:hypothetical protein
MEPYLSPRKSFIAIGVVCALSAVALFAEAKSPPDPVMKAPSFCSLEESQ